MDAIEHYLNQHEACAPQLPGHAVRWVDEHRAASLSQFREKGFPTQRLEDWRYTSVRAITGKEFRVGEQPDCPIDLRSILIDQLDSYQIVFVDGVFQSAPETGQFCQGLRVRSLAQVLRCDPASLKNNLGSVITKNPHGFSLLNSAFTNDGVLIELETGCLVDKPIELLFVSSQAGSFAQPRNLIVGKSNSKAQIIERYVSVGNGYSLTNSTTEIILSEHAEIDYYLVQTQSDKAYQVCGVWVKQQAASRFSARTVTLGGALVRNDLRSQMDGTSSHCDMFGLYSLSGRQHVDNHTTMIHGAAGCSSNELYKGVLDQRARGVFHGRIKVEHGAQKTAAEQTNNTLLLSRDAEIDTKPQLEIYADDVKCSHGATVGQIDETALFYLRSRGIDEADARSLLTVAFFSDVLATVDIGPLRIALENILSRQLSEAA